MIEYTPLSAEGKARILNGFMKPRLSRTQSVEQPKIVLVGAQPGAGKSKAASLAKSELRQEGGYIHVDADIMRAQIPAPEGVVYSSEQTQKDAGALAISVRNSAKENRRNIVEEGTFRNAASISQFIRDRKSEGYGVEMLAVATASEESVAGIFKRYEEQHAKSVSQPRFVEESYHNEAMAGFKDTLSQCESSFDRVRVTNRAGDILYDSLNRRQNQHETAKDALSAYQEITPKRLKQVVKAWDEIQLQAESRSIDPIPNYLGMVKQHSEVIYQRVEEIYRQERVVANSEGATLQRKSGDTWQDIEKAEAKGMKAGIHMLGTAKPAKSGREYSGEIVHKDEASVFQKTDQGLIRHKAVQGMAEGKFSSLSEQVEIGQKVSIKREGNELSAKPADDSLKKTMKR